MSIFTRDNPVLVGSQTGLITHFSQLWENTKALLQGDQTFDAFALNPINYGGVGTINNLNLDGLVTAPETGVGLMRFTNTAALELRGMSGGRDGRWLPFIVTNNPVRFAYRGSSSSSNNQFDTESVNVDGGQHVGKGGWGYLFYETGKSKWDVWIGNPGEPITPLWVSTDYAASGGTSPVWDVGSPDVLTHTVKQVGRLVTVKVTIATSAVTGTGPTELRVALRPGMMVAKRSGCTGQMTLSGGVQEPAVVFASAGQTYITITKVGGGAMSATGAQTTTVEFTFPDIEIT